MLYSNKLKKRLYMKLKIILISIFILIYGLFYSTNMQKKSEEINFILNEEINILKINYDLTINYFYQDAKSIKNNIENNEKVIEIFAKAQKVSEEERSLLRTKLYKLLTPSYKNMQSRGVLQFHFVFPNNVTFLRMHKPSKFGDDLSDIRYTFKHANETKESVKGFEQGRTIHSFRYVFPFYDKQGKHLGAIGIALSSSALQEKLLNVNKIDSHFLVSKNNFNMKAWKTNRLIQEYIQSIEHKDYNYAVNENTDHNKLLEIKEKIINPLRKEINKGIKSKKSFSLYLLNDDTAKVITFLSIINTQNNKNDAYLVSYSNSNTIFNITEDYYKLNIIIFIGLLLLFYFIYKNLDYKNELKENYKTLNKLTNNLPIALYQYRLYPDGKVNFPYASAGVQNIYEISSIDLMKDALPAFKRIHPDDLEILTSTIEISAKTMNDWDIEYRVNLPKKGLRWIEGHSKPEKLEDGSILWHGYLNDITERKEKEDALQLSNKRFESTEFAGNIGSWEFNIETQKYWGSRQAKIIYGLDDDNTSFTSSLIENCIVQKERVKQNLLDLIEKGTEYNLEYEINPLDGGKLKTISSIAIVEFDASKKPLKIIGFIQDITNKAKLKKDLEIEKNRFSLAIEGAKDGLWDWNLITGELFFSERFETMLGYHLGTLSNNIDSWLELLHPDDKEQANKDVEEYLSMKGEGTYESSFRLLTQDGSWKWILSRGKARFNDEGEPLRFVGFNTDITDQKNREKELTLAKESAIEASKAKSEFIANMSHEIRTPLNGVIGLTNLVLESDLDDIQRGYLSKSVISSNALLKIINDILDYSKIEANKIELENIPFTLDEILHHISDIFSYKAKEKNIELNFEIFDTTHNHLIGDPFRIKQVLMNLIGNALKFTQKGVITVEVFLIKSSNKQQTLLFSVRDSGIGIPKEKQEKLFHEFSQIDTSNTRKYGGTGLGLAISKKLVELMDGKISVESKEGIGSKFSFSITLNHFPKNTKLLTQNIKNKTILVITDIETTHDKLRIILESFDLKVSFNKDINEALATIKMKHFDYIIIDCFMIENNLEKLISIIGPSKKTELIYNIPYSIKDELYVVLKSKNLPYNKILFKPFCASTLLDILVSNVNNLILSENTNDEFTIKGKALLVEDNKINQIVAKQNLEKFGLDVDIAEDGFEAVQKVKEKEYDIVFMDLQMPRMDGFESTMLIREFDKEIPIIALSAAVQKSDRDRSSKSGMNEHLEKPIDINKLKEVIKKYVGLETKIASTNVVKEIITVDNIEGIDLISLIERIGDEKKAYKMLQYFRDNKSNIIEELQSVKIDSEEFNQLMHSLKGTSGNLSLVDVFEYSSKIYTTEDIKIKRDTLVKLINSIKFIFKTIDTEIKPKIKVNQDFSDFSLDELKEAIKETLIKIEVGSFIPSQKVEELLNQIQIAFDETKKEEIENYFSKFDYVNLQVKLNDLLKDI